MEHPFLIFFAGLLAGVMNSAAGGGSFVTLPVLVFAGVPSVIANASSTVALFPGSFAGAWAYRHDFVPFEGVSIRALWVASVLGGLAGALLLLFTPVTTFDRIFPWLLLFGTLAFTFGRQAGAALRRVVHIGPAVLLFGQFVLAIYGGYFGGAVGIMTLAVWSLFFNANINAMNAAKTLLVGSMNATAVVCFVIAGKVWWPQALVMMASAVVGGYFGAHYTRKLPQDKVRLGITLLTFLMTAAVFYRTYR
ncbi:UPF0721 transmembrane protein [Geomonas silvestris]|uniref:Probable membrane transporter protein n=1 Tax=Geomonas silvestris TaxID=2740184 RepID=A0A6V8MJI9_9BACT|nr:sulfite exporter TauE/SafE family protein [Geomonas silvestris]GFO60127.1 UPF0721 transmembrane protein [Geomonas silvestris]